MVTAVRTPTAPSVTETSAPKASSPVAQAPKAAPLAQPTEARLFSGEARRARTASGPAMAPQLRTRGELVRPGSDVGSSAVRPAVQARSATEVAPRFVKPTANETSVGKAFDALPVPAVDAKVRLLTENKDSWLAIWHVLKGASKELDATYFIFNRDVFGAAFLGTMLRKAREGTKVRLLLDASGDSLGRTGFTQTWRGQDYLQALAGAGGTVRVYHPLHKKVPKALLMQQTLMGIACNHDKLIRSENMAVTGGRNISGDYFVSPQDRGDVYRDTDVLVDGARASKQFEKAFTTEFDRDDLTYKIASDGLGDWHDRDGELIGSSYLMDAWLEGPSLSEAEKATLRSDEGARNAKAATLVEGVLARLEKDGIEAPTFFGKRRLGKLAEELVGYTEHAGAYASFDPKAGMRGPTPVKVLDRTSLGGNGADTIGPSLVKLAAAAKERIVITNPYVVITEGSLAALEAAGKRGVKIDILTNSPDSSDSMLTQAFFLADWPELMARVPNLRLFVFTGEQKLHAKTAMADDEISAVGSYNLDLLSSQVNGELVLATKSTALAKDLSRAHARDLSNPLQEVREYTIARNADGSPKLVDGKPVVTSGPEHHMTMGARIKYAVFSWLAELAKKFPALAPLALD